MISTSDKPPCDVLPRPGSGGPFRVRLSRKKGWRMPANTVKVDRSTRWGNPYKLTARTATEAVFMFEQMLDQKRHVWPEIQRNLKGKNLACWCPLDCICHADTLLRIANLPESLTGCQKPVVAPQAGAACSKPAPLQAPTEMERRQIIRTAIQTVFQRAGVPTKSLDVYGSQVVVTLWSEAAALRCVDLLRHAFRIRGMIKTTEPAAENKNTVLLPSQVTVWRVYACSQNIKLSGD